MKTRLSVTADSRGVPQAEVPSANMWELVEYLSFHRVAVTYHYHASHFTVVFQRQDAETAQRLLDNWADVHDTQLQMA